MASSPLVSVIVPCFNEERYIETFLEDVFQQDYPASSIEILIGDGIPFFRTVGGDIPLHLAEVHAYATGMLDVRYEIGTARAP